jgi:tetratricopeptide (TPR) repeat protein
MEFVDGCNLSAQLAATPQPAKEAARFVATLARAMHYAHEHGIIHRDLKPGNILLTRASQKYPGSIIPEDLDPALTDCVPKITDFGLAKKLDDASGPTRSGDVMGTPSYMSPEQAAGRLDSIGPATDVYALGAILYELLTARPPFKAETAMDTMFQVLYSEPVPPARLRAKMPRDLETICLKCLEKDASRRYPTALALAEDLERFASDQPIAARPVGPVGKALRWARRRPAAAALVAVSGLAFVVLLAGSLFYNVKQDEWNRQEKGMNAQLAALAESEKQKAKEAAEERRNAEKARDEAITQKNLARDRQLQAEHNFREALRAVDSMLNEVGATDLENIPLMDGVRRSILKRALDFHRGFLEQKSGDPAVRQQAARAFIQVGDIYTKLGDHAEAERAYGQAVKLFQKLHDERPDNAVYAQGLGNAYFHLAGLVRELERLTDAEKACRQALTVQTYLAAKQPQQPDFRRDEARSHNELARILLQEGQVGPAEKAYIAARDIQQALVAQNRDRPDFLEDYAGTLNDLGRLYAGSKRTEAAEKSYRQARDIFQQLRDKALDVAAYRAKLAVTRNNLGNALRDLSRAGEGEKELRAALPLWEQLATEFPATLTYRQELAGNHNNLAAAIARDKRRLAEAEKEYDQAVSILQKLSDQFPAVAEYRSALAAMLDNLAGNVSQQGMSVRARQLFDRAQMLHDAVRQEKPASAAFKRRLRTHHAALAEASLRLPEKGDKLRYADAAQAAEQLPKLYPDDSSEYYRAATLVARCVAPAKQDAGATASEKYARRAVALLEEAVQHGYTDVTKLNAPELAAIAERPDFKKLVADLEKKK